MKNQIASADHVEVETCPIHVSDCPAGTIRDADPERGRAARVYAQVYNMGLQPATNVRVTALFADASNGLPRIRLPVPPGSTWRLGLVFNVPKIPPGSSVRFSVIARQGDTVLGGNTYIIRSTQGKR